MSRLIYFDINGTLIKRDEKTDIPFSSAVDKALNLSDGMYGVNTSARSDKDVLIEVCEREKIVFTDELWQHFLETYKEELDAFAKTDVWRENDCAVSFVKRLNQEGYHLALISGELSIGAEYKLSKIGIWDLFQVGGFGEDGLHRFDLADAARKKAAAVWGDDFDSITVIGDTVLDIKTARHLGARVVSITTGSNSRSELAEHNPDVLIDSFSELAGVKL